MKERKGKLIWVIVISLILLLIIVAFFCFRYFRNNSIRTESNYLKINEMGKINKSDYENYGPIEDSNSHSIKPYQFSIKNSSDESLGYYIILEDIVDKKKEDNILERDYFHYELSLDNQVVKKGSLKDLHDNILYSNTISKDGNDQYSLRIWLSKEANQIDWMNKYYSYNLNVVSKNK